MSSRDKWAAADVPDQTGRVAVITGSNTGIGYHTAEVLAEHGALVVLAVRDLDKGNAAAKRITQAHPQAAVEVQELDLSSLASVREAADALSAAHARIDLLINNAGVMYTPKQHTVDGFELQFGVNHLGHFALTGLLLPRMVRVKRSRVVTVSSMAHRIMAAIHFDDLQWEHGYNRIAAYGQSKLANLMFARELQRRLVAAGSPLRSYAVHPGVSGTELFDSDKSLPGLVTKYSLALIGQPPERAAESIVFAAVTPDADPDIYWGPTKLNQSRGPMGPCPSNKLSKDRRLWLRLWEESEKMTGVSYPL